MSNKLEKMKENFIEQNGFCVCCLHYEEAASNGFDASTAYHAEIIQELLKALEKIEKDQWILLKVEIDSIKSIARQALESVRSKI